MHCINLTNGIRSGRSSDIEISNRKNNKWNDISERNKE